MDCSIDIGVRKALVILRVRLDALGEKGKALGLADCECIGIRIATTWNGETVASALQEVFAKSGNPSVILKDQGTDLKRGVQLWRKRNQVKGTWVIDDVGHAAANALKREFAGLRAFEKFLHVVRCGCSRLRQTELAFLMAPKVRTKGRFQGISRVAVWAENMIYLIQGQGRAPAGSPATRLRRMFAGLSAMRGFIERFAHTCSVTDECLELMKNRGLNQQTYRQAQELLRQLQPRSKLRRTLSA